LGSGCRCGSFYRRKCPLPARLFQKIQTTFACIHTTLLRLVTPPPPPPHLSQSPVISSLLLLSETVGVDTSLLNAPPPPARDPPDYKAGRWRRPRAFAPLSFITAIQYCCRHFPRLSLLVDRLQDLSASQNAASSALLPPPPPLRRVAFAQPNVTFLQRGNRFTKFDDISEFGAFQPLKLLWYNATTAAPSHFFARPGFPVRGVNVARDYQGDDAVDTGFVDQVIHIFRKGFCVGFFGVVAVCDACCSRRALPAAQMIGCRIKATRFGGFSPVGIWTGKQGRGGGGGG
jgi:hypothetical protein